MRVACLCDIHGNLPALTAVLAGVEGERVDLIVVGGDVVPGPLPAETLDLLRTVDVPIRYVMGNGDREVVRMIDSVPAPSAHSEVIDRALKWAASRLTPAHREMLASFEPLVAVDNLDAGSVLFCHGSPRNEDEIITAVTPAERLRPMLSGVTQDIVVCGHTHHQFDLRVDGKRVVNAGAVGMPYEGQAAAFWVVIDSKVHFCHTEYDVGAALDMFRAAGYPNVEETFKESLIEPAGSEDVANYFEEQAVSRE